MDLSRDGDVFVLRMDDGENRVDQAFVDEWNERIDEVTASEGPAALVTTGTEKFFSSGLDLSWLVAQHPSDAHIFFKELFASWARVLTLPMASVAAVNGHAYGAGALLALAHRQLVMREDRGWFCMPEADNGWTLQPAMVGLIRARMTPQAAHDTIMVSRRWTAPEALAAGFVTETAAQDAVLARAVEIAATRAATRSEALTLLAEDLYHDAVELLTSEDGITFSVDGLRTGGALG